MNTTQDKLELLVNTKRQIRNKIFEKGVVIPSDSPFSTYPSYIAEIDSSVETSSDLDIMQTFDICEDFCNGKYRNVVYTQAQIDEVNDLLDKILEGSYIINE